MTAQSPTDASGLDIIEVNGETFVAGLMWQPLRAGRLHKADAKRIGAKERMDVAIIRVGSTTQAGFAPKGKQPLKGLYSLAASLAGVLGDDWVGVFDIGHDRYALIAVHQGAVLPGYDATGPFDKIHTLLREAYSMAAAGGENGEKQSATRVIAPPAFGYGGDAAQLVDLLHTRNLKAEYKLRQLAFRLTPRESAMVAVAVITVGGIAYGVHLWRDAKDKAAAAAAASAIAVQQQARIAQNDAAQTPVQPWVSLPAAHAVLRACAAHWHATPLTVGGWIFEAGRCGASGASADYRRSGATTVAAFARAARARYGEAAVIIRDQGEAATITTPITTAPAPGDILQPRAVATEALIAHFQAIDSVAQLTLAEQPIPAPSPDAPDAPQPDWVTYSLSVTTAIAPDRVLAGLALDGVRITDTAVALSAETATLSWTFTGALYAR